MKLVAGSNSEWLSVKPIGEPETPRLYDKRSSLFNVRENKKVGSMTVTINPENLIKILHVSDQKCADLRVKLQRLFDAQILNRPDHLWMDFGEILEWKKFLAVLSSFAGFNIGVEDVVDENSNKGIMESVDDLPTTRRQLVVGERIIRDSRVTNAIKELYGCRCQVCGLRIETPIGIYAEGAHIKPLSDFGDDRENNLICLCPNHHVMLDYGCFSISNDFTILGEIGFDSLAIHPLHQINLDNLVYHRVRHGFE